MSSSYRIASPFLIRLAGVPFDSLENLSTTAVARAAREVIAREDELAQVRKRAWKFLSPESGLSQRELNVWRKALRCGKAADGNAPEPLQNFLTAARALDSARANLDHELETAVAKSRCVLLETSARLLPDYLVFGSDEVHHLTDAPITPNALPVRNSEDRKRERHLLLYLQRLAAKNDTFSRFGPCAWAGATDGAMAFAIEVVPGVTQRQVFPERWSAHALAAALNADPDVFFESQPRPNPNGRFMEDRFTFADSGDSLQLSPEQKALVLCCDGQKSMRDIVGTDVAAQAKVRELVANKVIIAAMETAAMEPFAFEELRGRLRAWPEGTARARWLPVADKLMEFAARFGESTDPAERGKTMADARDQLASLGVERKPGDRALYAAVNPIVEECARQCRFRISKELLDEVVNEAEPWIDFWRDSYAFVAGRVAANLRALLEKAGAKNGALPLPAFLRFCEGAKLALTGPGLVGMAHLAFQEVKAAFRERLRPHASDAEYELTREDCAVVRDLFDFPKFDEFTYPSADLQLAANSAEAVDRGEYRWVIGELHPAAATLHHCMFWSCPDKPALSRALQSMINGKPLPHFGFFAADFTAHTTVRVFDALPENAIFISAQRCEPHWRYVAPAEVEVFVDETGDVAMRRNDGEYLGSFARNWVIPLGFHPFLFTIAPHTPRLRCGRVVVQRRAWTVSTEELGGGNFTGVSRDLVVAVERLRAVKDWPRFIYIRPSEQALRRAGAENRDKDTKPVFIDLESYLFLEIFSRWLTKAGELEVTEMLPAPDKLLWQESDGRRTFELRTLICPR